MKVKCLIIGLIISFFILSMGFLLTGCETMCGMKMKRDEMKTMEKMEGMQGTSTLILPKGQEKVYYCSGCNMLQAKPGVCTCPMCPEQGKKLKEVTLPVEKSDKSMKSMESMEEQMMKK